MSSYSSEKYQQKDHFNTPLVTPDCRAISSVTIEALAFPGSFQTRNCICVNVSKVFKFYRNALYIADTEAERYNKKQKEMNVTTQVNIFANSYFFNRKLWL